MIARLTGTLAEKQAPHVLIDVNGVGYDVLAPMTTIYQLPAVGEKITLHTHFVVREDAQQLYGFVNTTDRRLFQDLIKVSGIGAKSALAILSGMETETFVQCILDSDAAMLSKIPGIGKKTAERLIVEMRDKLANWQGDLGDSIQATDIIRASEPLDSAKQNEKDAIDALVSLGYKLAEATKQVQKRLKEQADLSSEELIRLVLKGAVAV